MSEPEDEKVPPLKTRGLVEKLRPLLTELEGEGPHSEYVQPESHDADTFVLPMSVNAAHIRRLVEVLSDHEVTYPFDWPAWQGTPAARELLESPEAIAQADLLSLRRLVTAHIRQDRFAEGHLGAVAKAGHLAAIVRRLIQIL